MSGSQPSADERRGMEWWNRLPRGEGRRRLIALIDQGLSPTAATAWAAFNAAWTHDSGVASIDYRPVATVSGHVPLFDSDQSETVE